MKSDLFMLMERNIGFPVSEKQESEALQISSEWLTLEGRLSTNEKLMPETKRLGELTP